MTITASTFKTRFPEFVCESDDRIDLFISDAVIVLNSVYWGDKYDLGLSYLTAHYLVLGNKSQAGSVTGGGGPISGRAVDGASVNYTTAIVNDQSEAYYTTTAYGQRYLSLRKNLGVAASVI